MKVAVKVTYKKEFKQMRRVNKTYGIEYFQVKDKRRYLRKKFWRYFAIESRLSYNLCYNIE